MNTLTSQFEAKNLKSSGILNIKAPADGTYRVRLHNKNPTLGWTVVCAYTAITNPTTLSFYPVGVTLNTTTQNDITRPFTQTYGIRFNHNVIDTFDPPRCPPNTLVDRMCNCFVIPSTPNSSCDGIHHTNFDFLRTQAIAHSPLLGKREPSAIVTNTRPCLCNSVSRGWFYGVACPQWTISDFATGITPVHGIRIVQHETSHHYEALDHSPIPGHPCVMSGGFDAKPLSVTNIWCQACEQTMKTNRIRFWR